MDDKFQVIAMVLGTLLAISESLALIPSVKSNSIFQLVFNLLKKAAQVFKKKEEKEEPK